MFLDIKRFLNFSIPFSGLKCLSAGTVPNNIFFPFNGLLIFMDVIFKREPAFSFPDFDALQNYPDIIRAHIPYTSETTLKEAERFLKAV